MSFSFGTPPPGTRHYRSLTSISAQSLGIYGPTFEERRDGPLREYAMERLPEEWRDGDDR